MTISARLQNKMMRRQTTPYDETWDDIVSTQTIVSTREEALDSVVVGKPAGLPKGFLLNSFKRFWLWHVPIILKPCVGLGCLRAGTLLWARRSDGDGVPIISGPNLHNVGKQAMGEMVTLLLGITSDKSFWTNVAGVVLRFSLTSVGLIGFRICQRLSWRTTELGTFPSVKDDPTYQDEELLAKAWSVAARQGWKDPNNCRDYKEGVGGGAVVVQPRPGFCGIATLNSTLRSFGGILADGAAPYLSLHSFPRYVTMEEMVQLIKRVVVRKDPNEKSEWERGGGNPIESMQVIGGGKRGFGSLEQFRAALRQLSHPTQPARIMAIYHRSPLFNCSGDRSVKSKIACFPMVHWSPVLAYLEEEDLALVMDVNHHYGSKGYLVPTNRFYYSVNTRDIFNGNFHGLILLRPPPPKGELPLLTSANDISAEFGRIKNAYYEHQAAGRGIAADSLLESSEEGYMPLPRNEEEDKAIRSISVTGTDSNSISAVVSAHPVAFCNEIFLLGPGSIPSLDSVRSLVDVSTKLRVPARVAVRGCDSASAKRIHGVLVAAGFVQLMKSAEVLSMVLKPCPTSCKSPEDRLPSDYEIREVIHRAADKSHSEIVEELGRLIVASYKMPNVPRRGYSTADFYAHAYQTFDHGGADCDLRHFACFHRETGEMASCVALFCNQSGTAKGTRSDIAAIYNICTSIKHRRKGLGKTMTLFAMEQAKEMGCEQVLLEASREGKPLYQAMGFVKTSEEVGGIYLSLSGATVDFRWKNFFRLFELRLRLKNGGISYYPRYLFFVVRRMLTKRNTANYM